MISYKAVVSHDNFENNILVSSDVVFRDSEAETKAEIVYALFSVFKAFLHYLPPQTLVHVDVSNSLKDFIGRAKERFAKFPDVYDFFSPGIPETGALYTNPLLSDPINIRWIKETKELGNLVSFKDIDNFRIRLLLYNVRMKTNLHDEPREPTIWVSVFVIGSSPSEKTKLYDFVEFYPYRRIENKKD